MLRATSEHSPIGRMIAQLIDGGNLAPDELVMQYVVERLRKPDCQPGALFDGFPRTVAQAGMLDEYLAKKDAPLDMVIHLAAESDPLVKRLLERAQKESRADDTYETIQARLEIYDQRTKPVLDYYRDAGLVSSVDAMQTAEGVFQSICGAIEQRIGSQLPTSLS